MQHSIFEGSFQPPLVKEPGKIGTYRASVQRILLNIHGKAVSNKQFLQNSFKTARLTAKALNLFRNLHDLINIVLHEGRDLFGYLRMGRNKERRFYQSVFNRLFDYFT